MSTSGRQGASRPNRGGRYGVTATRRSDRDGQGRPTLFHFVVRNVLDQILDAAVKVGAEFVQGIGSRVVAALTGDLGKRRAMDPGCFGNRIERDPLVGAEFRFRDQFLQLVAQHFWTQKPK